jgi:molybdenum cofactor cytidylyltransferase
MTIVILAAGAARRMGGQKLLLPIDGRPMIAHVIAAAAGWPILVVTGAEVEPMLQTSAVRIVRNDAPERGMSHSLALADSLVTPAEPIAVLLGDLPDITPAAIAVVLSAYDETVDVVVPLCDGTFTHPVVFGPRARCKIPGLPEGDSLKALRDDPGLRRRIVPTDHTLWTDIDTPGDYAKRIGEQHGPSACAPGASRLHD